MACGEGRLVMHRGQSRGRSGLAPFERRRRGFLGRGLRALHSFSEYRVRRYSQQRLAGGSPSKGGSQESPRDPFHGGAGKTSQASCLFSCLQPCSFSSHGRARMVRERAAPRLPRLPRCFHDLLSGIHSPMVSPVWGPVRQGERCPQRLARFRFGLPRWTFPLLLLDDWTRAPP
jgi:hypothetical protein